MKKSAFKVVPLRTLRQLETVGDCYSHAYDSRKGRGAVSNLQVAMSANNGSNSMMAGVLVRMIGQR